MAHSQPAQAAVLGSPDTLGHILQFLCNKARARCEAVCRGWRAASCAAPLASARAEWDGGGSSGKVQSVAEVQWLGQHWPVHQARLVCVPWKTLAAIALGHWVPSLRELEVSVRTWDGPCRLDFQTTLQQFTLLSLGTTAATVSDERWVHGLGRLRTLEWAVRIVEEGEGPPELPQLPPRLQHLRINGYAGSWRFPAQLSALAGLKALAIEAMRPIRLRVAELQGLTALQLRSCSLVELPADLGQCTGLRYLDLWLWDGSVDALGEVLWLLPHLEELRLSDCELQSLPALAGGPAPPLRALDISCNNCGIPDAGWLASLEELHCSWWQVPGPELCAAASRLTEVVLSRDGSRATRAEAAAALAGLQALPALLALQLRPNDVQWEGGSGAAGFTRALCAAKPGLRVCTELDMYSELRRLHMGGLFELTLTV